jgi:hypothetical protein
MLRAKDVSQIKVLFGEEYLRSERTYDNVKTYGLKVITFIFQLQVNNRRPRITSRTFRTILILYGEGYVHHTRVGWEKGAKIL